jgi:hypothetical protein
MKLEPGSIVKISRYNERFWCIIKKIKGDNITAVVDNNLITKRLKYKDTVRFKKSDILDIYKDYQYRSRIL